MGDGPRRVALLSLLGAAGAVAAAVLFASELEADSDEAGGGVILVGVLTPLGLAVALRVLDRESRFLRDAATVAAGYGVALGVIAAGMRTIDASRGYVFFVVSGYFFVAGWVSALLVVGVRKLTRRALRWMFRRPSTVPPDE